MECNELLTDAYQRVQATLDRVLGGLSKADLEWQPKPDCNSIGWLAWHLTRQQDRQISALMGVDQLWITDNWYLQFARPPDPLDFGFGHTPVQVANFKCPDTEVFLGYHRAVLLRSISYFQTLSKEDLDRELDEPKYNPLPTVGVRLISIINDGITHAGQAAYLRGLLQGKGWQPF